MPNYSSFDPLQAVKPVQMPLNNIYSVQISDYKFAQLLLPCHHFPVILLLHKVQENNFQTENPLKYRKPFLDLKLFPKPKFQAPFFPPL